MVPKVVYEMFEYLIDRGIKTQESNIQATLFKTEFGLVWSAQGVENKTSFL